MNLSDHLRQWNAFSASWVDRPQDWEWRGPGGERQGFGLGQPLDGDGHHGYDIGRANLLWLSMELTAPPKIYDARHNGLFVMLVLHGAYMRLDGLPLFDQAESLTLTQFRLVCNHGKLTGPANSSGVLPVLKLLAARRLENAIS